LSAYSVLNPKPFRVEVKDSKHGINMYLEYFVFEDLIFDGVHQDRVLPDDRRAHGCMYYYLLAMKQLEKVGDSIDDQIILEGEPWQAPNTRNIRISVALLYGCPPEDFDKFWDVVDIQCRILGLPVAPDKVKMNRAPEIRSR